MTTSTTLDITGHRGLPVSNRLLRPDGPIEHLVVLLPGYGYTLDMPLFYYAENRAIEVGADVLRVEVAYYRMPEFQPADDDEQRRWLLGDTEAALRVALAQRPYHGVTLVGKSLGTRAMAHLLVGAPEAWDAVWLTPVLAEPPVVAGIRGFGGRSLVVIGTADPHYDPGLLADLTAKPGVETVVVDGADHGMDIPGDPVASVRAVGRYVEALVRFLPGPEGAESA